MMFQKHRIWVLPLLLLMLCIGGCRSHYSEPDMDPEEWDGDLLLVLNVYSGDISRGNTRAVTAPDGYVYPSLDTEKLQSLRVIIIKNDTVVHNTMEPLTYFANDYRFREYFKVDFSTSYRIYLIGNEAGISGVGGLPDGVGDIKQLLTSTLSPGKPYPTDCLENITMGVTTAGNPLIDNSSEGTKKPIPVTEFYDITTMARPDTQAQAVTCYDERSFFLTRAASKFSFHLSKPEIISDNTLSLKAIKISGLGSKEFLFPNNTEYVPEKKTDDVSDRYISSFGLPQGTVTGEYIFTIPDEKGIVISEISALEGVTFAPAKYFTENAPESGFTCAISFDGTNFTSPVALPGLPSMARNTHVKIDITFHEIGFEIRVEPWVFGGRTEIDMTEVETNNQ